MVVKSFHFRHIVNQRCLSLETEDLQSSCLKVTKPGSSATDTDKELQMVIVRGKKEAYCVSFFVWGLWYESILECDLVHFTQL